MSVSAYCGFGGVVGVVCVSCWTEPLLVLPLVEPPVDVDREDDDLGWKVEVLPAAVEPELLGSDALGAGVYGSGCCVAGGGVVLGVVAGGACATVVAGGGGCLSSCSSV